MGRQARGLLESIGEDEEIIRAHAQHDEDGEVVQLRGVGFGLGRRKASGLWLCLEVGLGSWMSLGYIGLGV